MSFRKPFTVTRNTPGTTIDGTFVPGPTTTLVIHASAQPLKPEEVEQFNFGRRIAKFMFLFTSSQLYGIRPGDATTDPVTPPINPDSVSVYGESFLVEREEVWQNGVIPYFKYLVTRELEQ